MVASVPEFAKRQRGSPQRRAQLARDDDRVLGRLGRSGCPVSTCALTAPTMAGMGVPGEGGAVAVACRSTYLVAVGVVDLAMPAAVAEPDRLRLGDLPVRS